MMFIFLFTPLISDPLLIYLKDTEDKYAKIYSVNDINKLTLLTSGNRNYFLHNLKYCKELETLIVDMDIYPDIDISSLSESNIDELILVNNKWNDDFIGIKNLKHLSFLNSDHCNCEKLENLDDLKELIIEADEIENVDSLSRCSSLEDVSLNSINLIFMPIANLKELKISADNIENIECIENMKNLESISISNVQTGEINLEVFDQLPKLKKLIIHNCKTTNSDGSQKEYIDIYENKLEEFDIS